MQRAHHGEQADWMLMVLASMIGQVGLPGADLDFLCIIAAADKRFRALVCP